MFNIIFLKVYAMVVEMGALVILYKRRKGKNQFNCDKDKIDFSLFYFKLIQNNMCAMITTPRSSYYAHKI